MRLHVYSSSGLPMLRTLATTLSIASFICQVAIAADASMFELRVVSSTPTQTITVANSSNVQELSQLDKDVHSIVWRRDGSEIAFVEWEKPLQILDPNGFGVLRTIGDGRRLIDFAFSPDEGRVAFCENGTKRAEILNIRTGNRE
jgi:Tol biopolymer transport system component